MSTMLRNFAPILVSQFADQGGLNHMIFLLLFFGLFHCCCLSMSHHNVLNLHEKISSNVTTKLMQGIKYLEEMDRPCNFKCMSLKADDTCLYKGVRRKGTIVYELCAKTTCMAYVGKTQW